MVQLLEYTIFLKLGAQTVSYVKMRNKYFTFQTRGYEVMFIVNYILKKYINENTC